MKLTEYKLSEFVDVLAGSEPAPGGGSVSALAASLGSALTNMVCALTAGKKKYAEHEALALETSQKITALRARLMDKINEDTAVYNGVSAVFAMPKDTDVEKTARKDAMEAALKAATLVPFDVMGLCLEGLLLTSGIVGKSNPNTASDLGVAALCLGAGVKGAWLNVLINLSGIKDEGFTADHKQKGADILAKAAGLADDVYARVLGDMGC